MLRFTFKDVQVCVMSNDLHKSSYICRLVRGVYRRPESVAFRFSRSSSSMRRRRRWISSSSRRRRVKPTRHKFYHSLYVSSCFLWPDRGHHVSKLTPEPFKSGSENEVQKTIKKSVQNGFQNKPKMDSETYKMSTGRPHKSQSGPQ